MKRIEALVDALGSLNRAWDPDSAAYALRNPAMLRAFLPKHECDENKNRRFKTLVAGYENAIFDITLKCLGKSSAKISPETTLGELLTLYQQPPTAARYVVKFLKKALREDPPENLKARWFLED